MPKARRYSNSRRVAAAARQIGRYATTTGTRVNRQAHNLTVSRKPKPPIILHQRNHPYSPRRR